MSDNPPLESEYAEIARRLRGAEAEIERLRAALRRIANAGISTNHNDNAKHFESAIAHARAALGGNP